MPPPQFRLTPRCLPVARRCAAALALLAGLALHTARATTPEELVYLTEDYPPSNFVLKGQLQGIAVDVLKQVWKQMGVAEQPIQVVPWARGMKRVESEPDVVLFAMSRRPEREARFQWVGPIYRGRWAFYTAAQRRITMRSSADLRRHHVGVLRADSCDEIAASLGLPDLLVTRVASIPALLKMLDLGRIDAACLYADSLGDAARHAGLEPGRFREAFTLQENGLYFAFSLGTSPALVARFQQALNAVDAERQRIAKAYGGTP